MMFPHPKLWLPFRTGRTRKKLIPFQKNTHSTILSFIQNMPSSSELIALSRIRLFLNPDSVQSFPSSEFPWLRLPTVQIRPDLRHILNSESLRIGFRLKVKCLFEQGEYHFWMHCMTCRGFAHPKARKSGCQNERSMHWLFHNHWESLQWQ